MRRKLRAVRAAGPKWATCDEHLSRALRRVTSPVDGEDNDTHVVVRRLGDDSDVMCDEGPRYSLHPATWVLIPQAVLR